MAQLYDYATEKTVTVPEEDVQRLVSAGTHSFLADGKVHVFAEDGQIFNLPAEKARTAFGQGYRYATEPEVEYEKLREYVDERPTQAALLGFLRTMSFGFSDAALQAVGIDEELIRLHRQENPLASGLGEVGGYFVPGSLPAKVGGRLANAALRMSPNVVKNSRLASGAVRGTVEGGVYALPLAVSDTVLDMPDAPTFGENVLAGMQFGGVTGGVVGFLSASVQKGRNKLAELADYNYYRSLGARTKEYNKVTQRGEKLDRVQQIGRRLRELDETNAITTVRDHEQLLVEIRDDLLPKYGQDLQKLIDEIGTLEKSYRTQLRQAYKSPQEIAQRMRDEVLTGPLDPATAVSGEIKRRIKRISKIIDEYEQSGAATTFESLETVKREFYKLAYDESGKASSKILADAFKKFGGVLKDESEGLLARLETQLQMIAQPGGKVRQGLLAEFVETKAIYGDLRDLETILVESVKRGNVNNMIPLTSYITGGAAFGGIAGAADSLLTGSLVGTAAAIGGGLIRKFAKDNGELLLARSLGRLSKLGGVLEMSGQASVRTAKAIDALVKGTPIAQKLAYDSDERLKGNYLELKKGVALLSNPAVLQDRIQTVMEGVNPDTGVAPAIEQTLVRAVNYTAATLPRNPLADAQILGGQEYTPSTAEMRKYLRRIKVVDDPISALESVARGTITPEEIDALKSVYPNLYNDQVQKVLAGLADAGTARLTLQQRIALSKFVGKPTDPAMKYTQQLQAQLRAEVTPQLGGGVSLRRNVRGPEFQTSAQSAQIIG